MIQKVFLDTNVLLDLLLDREQFAQSAEDLFNLREEYGFEIHISALSIANIACTLDKLNMRPHAIIGKLLSWVRTVDLTAEIVKEAVVSKFDDFEDGLQYSSAVRLGVDVIVTRNKKDFKYSLIPILSPKEFLDSFKP